MSLQQWADNGWLRPHVPSRQEIRDLLEVADRDVADASAEAISPDWRFGIAYNAALKLATILLAASGYRAERVRQHYLTLQAIPLVLGEGRGVDAAYLDNCRKKRNTLEYERVGGVTAEDANELIEFVRCLRTDALAWVGEHHPDLLP